MAPATIVFSKISGCEYCDKAKALLQKHGVEYEERALEDLAALRREVGCFVDPAFVKSFPQIVYNRAYCGGFEGLRDKLEEPLLQEDLGRFTLLIGSTMKYPHLWDMYQKQLAAFWTAEEISFTTDQRDWDALSDDERHFLKHILAFFAGADGIVNDNLLSNFYTEVQVPEARTFYAYQVFNEGIHATTYSLLIDSFIKEQAEKDRLFNAIKEIPVISDKADWVMAFMNPSRPFAERLLGFICCEGLLFASSFASIDYFKQKNVLPALAFSNTLIARDEAHHQQFGEALYRLLKYPLPAERALEIVKGAVEVEENFTRLAVPCRLAGINPDLMCQYVRHVADRILMAIGLPKHYNAQQPFDFIQRDFQPKNSFFEIKVDSYRKPRASERIYSYDEDF